LAALATELVYLPLGLDRFDRLLSRMATLGPKGQADLSAPLAMYLRHLDAAIVSDRHAQLMGWVERLPVALQGKPRGPLGASTGVRAPRRDRRAASGGAAAPSAAGLAHVADRALAGKRRGCRTRGCFEGNSANSAGIDPIPAPTRPTTSAPPPASARQSRCTRQIRACDKH
jgi:hypothetical protein